MEVETADKQINNIIIDLINVIKNKTTEEATNTNTNQLDDDELKQSLIKLIQHLNLSELRVTQSTAKNESNEPGAESKVEISLFDETWNNFTKLRSVYYLQVVIL